MSKIATSTDDDVDTEPSCNHYYIMNASSLFDNRKTTLGGCLEAWGDQDQTILVCRRQTRRGQTPDEMVRIFVAGSGIGYVKKDDTLPKHSWYTQDTGIEYKNKDMTLYIENVIEVVDGKIMPRNMVGVTENRNAWCMK